MKVAEIILPDDWEPGKCTCCPFWYWIVEEDLHKCVLDASSGCPVKAKEVSRWEYRGDSQKSIDTMSDSELNHLWDMVMEEEHKHYGG